MSDTVPQDNQPGQGNLAAGTSQVAVSDTHPEASNTPRILVPLDGSATAELVLPHACSLARATSSGLLLLRVVSMQKVISPLAGALPSGDTLEEIWEAELALAKDYLGSTADRLCKEGLSVEATVLEDGDAAVEIVEYIERRPDVTMIAMTTHGRTGLGRRIFGGVAEKVLRTSPVPLLLVRPAHGAHPEAASRAPALEYHTIVVPLDGSPLAEQALDLAQTLVAAESATVIMMSVVPYESARARGGADSGASEAAPWEAQAEHMTLYLEGIAGRIKSAGLAVQAHVACGDPAAEITAFSERAGAGLIVMATHSRSGLQRLWLGSVALRVAQSARLPVLLVRAKDPAYRQE